MDFSGEKTCDPGTGFPKGTSCKQTDMWLNSILSKRKLETVVDTEFSMSHRVKVASRDANAVSTSL